MKKTLYLISALAVCLLACTAGSAQIINTYAGVGIAGETGDGSVAVHAEINTPQGIAMDKKGNLYIADAISNVVRKVSSSGIIYTIAGTGTSGYNGDSILAIHAELNNPLSVAADIYGNVYIADNSNFRVRRIDTFGIITTVAGVGGLDGFGLTGDEGLATDAHLYVTGIAVDNDQNIYIADGNTAVRKVDHISGIINSIAGGSSIGYSGDSGIATYAVLTNPYQVALDTAGNIYISDYGNNRVRRISKVTDIITTVAGNGVAGGLSGDGDGGPATSAKITPYYLAVDAVGNIYVSDALYGHVRRVDAAGIITTVAGSADTALGDGGPATSANINQPMGVVTGLMGTLYIADEGHSRIRRVTGLPYTVQLCAGTAVVVADSGLWVSTAPAIASASGPGIITGATPGAATLTCTSGADTLATINVVVDTLPMAGTISGTDSVCPGDTLSFTLAGALAGGLWSVADTLHATLLSPDMVKGIAPGSDAVLYTVNNGQCSNAAILAFTVRSLASCGDTVVPSSVATLAAGSTAISIYPNPNTGTFTIAGTWAVAGDMAATITITDVLGHTIYRTTAATTGGLMSARIAPATTLASGIYMVQLLRGAERSTVHFIVQ